MAAAIEEPTGKVAGRVTIWTTFSSLIPPVVVSLVIIVCFLVGMISAEIAGVAVLSVLGVGSLTTGTVFSTAKNTPTDQGRPTGASAPAPEAFADAPEQLADPEGDAPAPAGRHSASLADTLEQYRPGGVS